MYSIDETLKYKGDGGEVLEATVMAVGNIETAEKTVAYYNCVTKDGDIITLREDQVLLCDITIPMPAFNVGMKVAYTDYEESKLAIGTITDIKIELSMNKEKEYETLTTYVLDTGVEIYDDEVLSIQ